MSIFTTKMKKILYLLIFSSALFSQEMLDEVVVSDTRTKKSIKKTGRNVIIINQKEIELKKEYSIAQILNQYAGIYISGAQLHPGQNLTYSIRGGNNRQVQIRIDDVVVFDPSLIESEFDLRMLSLINIESIEIIKGASSSLYGSGASTAVINIKTMDKKDDKLSLNFNSQWGTQNIQNEKINSLGEFDQQSFYIGSKLKNVNLTSSFSKVRSDGISSVIGNEEDKFLKENFNLKLKSDYNSNYSWKAFFSNDFVSSGYDSTFPTYSDADNLFSSRNQSFGFNPELKIKKSNFKSNFHWLTTERIFSSDFPISYDSEVFSSELTWEFYPSENIFFLSGLLFQNIKSSFEDDFSNEGYSNENLDIFLSINSKLLKNIDLHLSARNSNNSEFGSFKTYTINPFYLKTFNDNSYLKIYLNHGTSFIAPSQYKLFSSLYGNIELSPERNQTSEIGLEFKSMTSRVSAIIFQRNEENVVEFFLYPDFSGRYVNNSNKLKTNGVELEATYFFNNLKINSNYTFINKISQEILRLPNKKANVNLEYSFKKITLTTNYNHIGTRDDRNLETFEINELPSYGLLDFGILIPNFVKDSSLSLLITNILDKEYFEYFGYSTLGRNIKISLNLNL